jgi:hypothetical protein
MSWILLGLYNLIIYGGFLYLAHKNRLGKNWVWGLVVVNVFNVFFLVYKILDVFYVKN